MAMDTALAGLSECGFQKVGCWELGDGGNIAYSPLGNAGLPKSVLYAFVCEGCVLYVGRSALGLVTRMNGYQSPGPTQRTNIRVNEQLRKVLQDGQCVEIHVLVDGHIDGNGKVGEFDVDLAAGLEGSIIQKLKPTWNVAGRHGGTVTIKDLLG